MPNFSEFDTVTSPDDDAKPARAGHVPLLWICCPLILTFGFCFAFDLHLPRVGVALLVTGALASLAVTFLRPARKIFWSGFFLIGVIGLALFLFSTRIAPLPDWQNLPPREAELELRWEQVFASRPESKTVSGIARVTASPDHLKHLTGCDIYCQIRRPVPSDAFARGVVFQAVGVLDTVERNFADSDAQGFVRYLKNRRATMTLTRGRFIAVTQELGFFQKTFLQQNATFESTLRRGLEKNPEAANLLVAMLLGQKSALPADARLAFTRTGTMHLFAISGLHIGIIAAGLFWFVNRFCIQIPDTARRLLVLTVLLAFVLITGASPSALRAWLMVACIFAARMIDRSNTPFVGLVLAATLSLLWNPRALLDIGFQLSYGVVASILLYGIPFAEWLNSRWVPWRFLPPKDLGWLRRFVLWLKRWFVVSLGIGMASTLASSPLIVGHFNLFSAGAIAVNLVVVPLATPVILMGFCSLFLGTVGLGFLSAILNWASGKIIALMAWMTGVASSIPFMAWTMSYRAEWIAPSVMLLLLGVFLVVPMRSPKQFFIPPSLVFLSFLLGTV